MGTTKPREKENWKIQRSPGQFQSHWLIYRFLYRIVTHDSQGLKPTERFLLMLNPSANSHSHDSVEQLQMKKLLFVALERRHEFLNRNLAVRNFA